MENEVTMCPIEKLSRRYNLNMERTINSQCRFLKIVKRSELSNFKIQNPNL